MLNRRSLLAGSAMLFGAGLTSAYATQGGKLLGSKIKVDAPIGRIEGFMEQGIANFLGLRYATAPVGEARFQPPRPLDLSPDTIDATQYGNRNFQAGLLEIVYGKFTPPGAESEDCLFLNVHAPEDLSRPKPVMVWIHGGAFTSGSGGEYDVSRLVQNNDVVVVTINYRLGAFGFLNLDRVGSDYAGSANLGIQDQIAALNWVKENIGAFGGDPSNVTLFGESAGAASIFALLGAPSAQGLFHKAMPFSGGETLTPPIEQLDLIKQHFKSSSDEECVAQLMAIPAAELHELLQRLQLYAGPSLDGKVITMPAVEAIREGMASNIPILTGATKDEGTLLAGPFVANEQAAPFIIAGLAASIGRDDGAAYLEFLNQTVGDDLEERMSRAWFDTFRASALRVASTASVHGAGGWVYNFDVETDHPLGVTHFADVPFTFGWIEENHPRLFVHPPTEINRQLADRWSKTLVEFATTGSPNGHGLPDWPQYSPDAFDCLRISQQPEVVSNPDGADMLKMYKVV